MKKIIIYCLIFAVIPALAARESKGEEEYSQSIRELTGIHYARARNYYHKGEYSKAKAEFQEVLELAPWHQGARWYLKRTEKELAKYENRKTFWGRRNKLKEKGKPAQEKARSRQPERKEVRLKAQEKEQEEPEKIKQLYEEGKDCFSRGFYPEAMACFEKVIELGGNP